MLQVSIIQALSTELSPEFNSVKTIEIDDKSFSEGNFGEVFFCRSINNKAVYVPQIIKIFKSNQYADLNYKTIQKLQNKLKQQNNNQLSKNGKTILEEYPAFAGVPQFSFEGTLNGKRVKGFSANNLKHLGFTEFKDILNDDNLLNKYQSIETEKKILIAYHFISAFKILRECSFIHADLKPECLFVHLTKNQCAIIDYDSGVVTYNITDQTTTWGTPNDWIAPEIWKQLGAVTSHQSEIRVDLFTDMWSVAIGIHYILSTCHPLFYLSELSPRVINQYFIQHKNKWPNINKSSSYFNKDYESIYDRYVNWLNTSVPQEIISRLSATINNGYLNPALRTSYDIWKIALEQSQKPPVILNFLPSRNYIIDGIEAKLFWKVENAHTLQIDNGIGVVSGNEVIINPKHDTKYTLTAIGHFGIASISTDVKVFPTPIIQSLFVPSPDFQSRANVNQISIKSPSINNSVSLNPNAIVPKPSFTELNVSIQNSFPEHKPKISFWGISEAFNKIKNVISQELNK